MKTEGQNDRNRAALMSGDSDQHADSDEYQEINDKDLETFEEK